MSPEILRPVLLLVAIGTLLGCADHVDPPSVPFESATTVVQELTIGTVDGPEEYSFHAVMDLAVLDDGSIWVMDGGVFGDAPLIRRYDADGGFLGYVGTLGEGPGEYRNPYAMAVFPDGRVVVRDRGFPQRLNIYGTDGATDATWTLPTPLHAVAGAQQTLLVDAEGSVWLQVITGRPSPQPDDREVMYVRLDPEGSVLDTVPIPSHDSGDTRGRRDAPTSAAGGTAGPFQPRPFSLLGPHGRFAVGETGEYAIALVPAGVSSDEASVQGAPGDGSSTIEVRREVPPVPVSEAERLDWQARLEARVAEGMSEAVPEIPRVKPPIGGVRFGQDGRLWVRLSMPALPVTDSLDPGLPDGSGASDREWYEPRLYDVFEPDGRYVERVHLPADACRGGLPRTFLSRGHHIWCVERDPTGVESVARYRIGEP